MKAVGAKVTYRSNLLGPAAAGPAAYVRYPARLGLGIIAVFILVFGVWGGLAPLAGGAVASGYIAPFGSVRTVQHLEGGIVDRIMVREGDHVAAGTPLLELRSVAPQTEVATLLDRRRARAAESARLQAELAGSSEIAFPDELLADPDAAPVMAAETRILNARDAIIDARKRVLGQRIEQLDQQIVGYRAQVDSSTDQLALVEEEISDKSTLLAQGLTPKAELLRLQRDAAQIRGFRGEYVASIAAAEQQVGETEIELLAIDAERMELVSEKASVVRGELAEIEQMLAARHDVLDRTVLTAPLSGIVGNMRIKTEGGVIGAGEPVLDIVPSEEKLVIDVSVSPLDIDMVEVGMRSYVHLSALSSRKTPRVLGTVTTVSPTAVIDAQNRYPHYFARIEVSRSELDAADVHGLMVGMPAEVLIVARERTMVDYILQPFTDALWRSGREV